MVASVVIHSATVVSDGAQTDDGWVAFDGTAVSARGDGSSWRELCGPSTQVIDASGLILTPGFVDIHVHGGGGASFLDGPEALAVGLATHRQYGTTRSVVSLVSGTLPELNRQLGIVREFMQSDPLVLGTHLEGPFLSRDFKGAHDETVLTEPALDRVAQILDAAQGTLRQITLAPELADGLLAIEEFSRRGVAVAVGHTAAGYEEAREAFDAGASILTHAFNGMKGIHHRAPGPVTAAIDSAHVTIELIGDGTHVYSPTARLVARSAPNRLCLVTDAMAAAGSSDGDYLLGSLAVRVRDGVARLAQGDSIAGSTLTMNRALSFGVTELEWDLPTAVSAATTVPARALGLDDRFGSLSVGYPADAVLLNSQFEVQHVWADGSLLTTTP